MRKNWSGERLETFIYSRDAIEHLHRYSIVNDYIENKVVLDIACGEGYGSNLMANEAKFVYAVDIDEVTILNAKSKYNKQNLGFLNGSAFNIPIQDSSIDVVISFETLEHHDKHYEMLSEIKRVLKPHGVIIISTPDKLYYSDIREFKNKFHEKELYKIEFTDLLTFFFNRIQLLTQKYTNGTSIIQDEKDQDNLIIFTGNYSTVQLSVINPLYLIIIASDEDFIEQGISIFDGYQILEKEIKGGIYFSNSYKLGHLILSPFKLLKKLFS